MDHRPGLNQVPPTPGVEIEADQAVFTSIRGPMGEGYRLVAMSPGITAEERAELTRRSPSHESLCAQEPSACGLSSYPLAGGRQCIGCSRYGGREHTGRGQRVHTHLVLLNDEAFRCFGYDPLAVQAALLQTLGSSPDLKPPTCMEPVLLLAPGGGGAVTPPPAALFEQASRLAERIGAAALAAAGHLPWPGCQTIAAGLAEPGAALATAMHMLPVCLRRGLSASIGLKHSRPRQIWLTCLPDAAAPIIRATMGQDIDVLDLAAPASAQVQSLSGWLGLCRERWQAGRWGELARLAAEIIEPLAPANLQSIVTITSDADGIETAAQSELEGLVQRYAGHRPGHAAEEQLARQLISAAVRRSAILHRAPAGN